MGTVAFTSPDDIDVLVTAAVMYYEQGEPQQVIADQLGVSRATVSRALSRARELGIVRIVVVPPHVDPALPRRLRKLLGLHGVHVASGRAEESEPGPVLAEPLTAALDEARLESGDVVLVSWGRAVNSVGRYIRREHPGVFVVPAMGGNASDRPWFQPNEVARSFAHALGAQPRFLNAPALVSPNLAESLRSEAEIAHVVELWDHAKVAVVGVGSWPKPDSSYAAAGFPVDDPALAGAVGDVAGWSFTLEGEIVHHRDSRELLGVTPEQLRRIPNVICLAGGVSKARAAIGSARAGLVNVLVTDAPTARAIDVLLADSGESRGGPGNPRPVDAM